MQLVFLMTVCSGVNQQTLEVFDLAVILCDNEYFFPRRKHGFCFFALDECFLVESRKGYKLKTRQLKRGDFKWQLGSPEVIKKYNPIFVPGFYFLSRDWLVIIMWLGFLVCLLTQHSKLPYEDSRGRYCQWNSYHWWNY